MKAKPPADLPPPKRPWNPLDWLMLFTPGPLILAGVLLGNPTSKQLGPYLAMLSVYITVPVAFLMCMYLGSRLTNYIAKDDLLVSTVVWVLCCGGLLAVNFAIAFAGCSILIN